MYAGVDMYCLLGAGGQGRVAPPALCQKRRDRGFWIDLRDLFISPTVCGLAAPLFFGRMFLSKPLGKGAIGKAVLLVIAGHAAGFSAVATATPLTSEPKGLYATVSAGASWPKPIRYDDSRLGPLLPIEGTVQADPGFAVDVGVGYDFGSLRSELTVVHRQGSIRQSSWTVGANELEVRPSNPLVTSNSVFASLYLDLPVNNRLVPYVGGGLGYTNVTSSSTELTLGAVSQSVGGWNNGMLGYQAKAGLAYRSSPRSDLFAEAVYQGSPAVSRDSLERSALNSWGCRFGVRYRFGPLGASAGVSQ